MTIESLSMLLYLNQQPNKPQSISEPRWKAMLNQAKLLPNILENGLILTWLSRDYGNWQNKVQDGKKVWFSIKVKKNRKLIGGRFKEVHYESCRDHAGYVYYKFVLNNPSKATMAGFNTMSQ